jgi:hypothetical protein
MQTITASVTAAIVSRLVQLMPRLSHQSSAQHIMTGTMVSSCRTPVRICAQRQGLLEVPAPTLMVPPILTQVSVPSTLTKPGP